MFLLNTVAQTVSTVSVFMMIFCFQKSTVKNVIMSSKFEDVRMQNAALHLPENGNGCRILFWIIQENTLKRLKQYWVQSRQKKIDPHSQIKR